MDNISADIFICWRNQEGRQAAGMKFEKGESRLDNKRTIVYFRDMRTKDENKKTAICNAAIELITREGFAAISMSKIARAANLSAATIYIYFENKEDLLNKLYIWIKQESGSAFLNGLHEEMPVKEGIEMLWRNIFAYIMAEPGKFFFGEQFANSPLVNRISKNEGGKYYQFIFKLLQRGIDEGIIKDVPTEILAAYIFAPAMLLAKRQFNGESVMTQDMMQSAFSLTWDAVRV